MKKQHLTLRAIEEAARDTNDDINYLFPIKSSVPRSRKSNFHREDREEYTGDRNIRAKKGKKKRRNKA